LGNDKYYIHDTNDQVIEYADQGDDTVYSYVTTYTLTDNVYNLKLWGDQSVNGTGNGLDNGLAGNDQNNILAGHDGNDHLDGGQGADLLIGGKGDDNYNVDSSSDVIWEIADQGNDVVHASATFTLSGHLENLYLEP